MASSSITNFSIHHSPSKLNQSPKILYPWALNSVNSLSLPRTHLQNLTLLNNNSKPLRRIEISLRPILKFALINHVFSPTRKMFSQILSRNIVLLLVGSFIFMGSFRARPVIAQPIQESANSVEEKSEDEEMYVKLLDENPRNVEALKMIVNVKMRYGKTKEAVEYVERLIKMQPDEVEWRLLQALCYEMMGQLSKAKTLFKDILKKRPLLLRALHGLAMVMHKNFEGPAVFEMLNSALELACRKKQINEERNIRILIAQMHIVKGELEEALEKFEKLVNENPRDFRPYLCQGIIYSLLEKKKEAEEQFEIYRSLVPEEFPQRGFLDDVVLAAKTESRQQLDKKLKS